MPRIARRSFLRAGLGSVVPVAHMGASGSHGDGWRVVSSPTSNTLHDVAVTSAGPYAVGANGVVLARRGGTWTQVLADGPSGNGHNLVAAAVTDDGDRLWVAGASGALGEYDVSERSVVDRTAPAGTTANFTGIAVAGSAGAANVYVADASGHVHASFANGRDGSWSSTTPGSGASIRGIDLFGAKDGALVDGNRSVFLTADGESWTEIGIEDATHDLTALDAASENRIRIVGGAVYSRTGSDADSDWAVATPTEKTLQDVVVGHCGCVHAVGAGGTVLKRPGHGMPGVRTISRLLNLWSRSTPTTENLHGIALGPPHVAVGAAGTILER